jgi:hypothetical protein
VSIPANASYPQGYNAGEAFIIARSSDGFASDVDINGVGAMSGGLALGKDLSLTIAGVGALSADMALLVPLSSTLAGVGAITPPVLQMIASIASGLAGTGEVSDAALSLLVGLNSNLAGVGGASADFIGVSNMGVTISIGVEPPGISPSDVWTYDISGISTVGTSGKKLNDAASGENTWDVLTYSHSISGSFGSLMKKLLTVAKFLGLK